MADTRIDELRRRLERDPGSRLFAHLAEELRKAGEVEEAITVARAGLEQHPGYPSARLTLGRALLDAGDAAAAKAELESAVRGAPDNILASRVLAEAHEALGDLGGALAQYRGTLEMAPGDTNVGARVRALEEKLRGGGGPGPEAPPEPHEATKPVAGVQPQKEAEAGGADAAVGPEGELPPTVRVRMPAGPGGEARAPLPPTADAAGPGAEADRSAAPSPARYTALEEPLPPTLPMGVRVSEVLRGEGTPPAQEQRSVDVGAQTRAGGLGTATAGVGEATEKVTGGGGRPVEVPNGDAGHGAPAPAAQARSAASGAGEPAQAPLSSATLAELYLKQGLVERAVEVFRQVLDEEPGNEAVRHRLAEIQRMASASAAGLTVSASDEGDEGAFRRRALERAIARLEALLAVVRRGR